MSNNKNTSIIGVLGGVAALIGCFLPFVSGTFGIQFSFMDMKKALDLISGGVANIGYNVPIQYQLITFIPVIFLVACVLGIIFSLTGNKGLSRIAGIVNIVIIACVLFFPIAGGQCLAQVFSHGVSVGAGLILMCVGAIGMLISA